MSEEPVVQKKGRKLTARGRHVRDRIVAITAHALGRDGYGATTLAHVSSEAGISRGSILHQFPSRLELMQATSRYIADGMAHEFESAISAIDHPWVRMRAYPDLIADLSRHALAQALMEIQLAARWDDGLAEKIRPATDYLKSVIYTCLKRDLDAVNLDAFESISARIQMMGAANQGLSLDLNISEVSSLVPAARTLMKEDFVREIDERRRNLSGRTPATGREKDARSKA